ncbi:MAG: hypothetical protein AAF368_12835, partial [Planctomycetota bacterium]
MEGNVKNSEESWAKERESYLARLESLSKDLQRERARSDAAEKLSRAMETMEEAAAERARLLAEAELEKNRLKAD